MTHCILLHWKAFDKAGKASQVKMLVEKLKQNDYLTLQSEFHDYSSPTGQLIMKWLTGEFKAEQKAIELIMTADKQNKQEWIKSLENSLDFLVLDRYTLSQLVYSISNGVDSHWTYQLQKYIRMPNLNIVIDIPPEVSMSRKGKHNNGENDKYESDLELLTKVRNNYIAYADVHEDECVVINGEQSMEKIHKDIWDHLVLRGIVK